VRLAILSGTHLTFVPLVIELLTAPHADDVWVPVGGSIPTDNIPEPRRLGVAEVFTTGAPTHDIVEFIPVEMRP
jgi:methylmalonyl-CoA mutase C-terminal domain/subunit